MDNNFPPQEKLYRAVYPPSHKKLFWKRNGELSSAALEDPKGLSVDRENFRGDYEVIKVMKSRLHGCIISLTVKQCTDEKAVVKYKKSHSDEYHSEIHGSKSEKILSHSQRYNLAALAKIEYKEE